MTSLEQFNHLLQLAKVRLNIAVTRFGEVDWELWDYSNPDSPVLIYEDDCNHYIEFGVTHKSNSEGK